MKNLLIDIVPVVNISMTESDDGVGGKRYTIKGEIGRCDVETANGRIYPRKVMEREIKKIQKQIKEGKTVYGELDHPADGKTKLGRSSHYFTDIYIDDDGKVIGEAIVLISTGAGTPGFQLRGIIADGGKFGASSRAFGTTKVVEGKEYVNDDLDLMTYDFVANPAITTAYPNFVGDSSTKEEVYREDTPMSSVPAKVEVHYFPNAKEKVLSETKFNNEGNVETVESIRKKYPELILKIEDEHAKRIINDVTAKVKQEISSVPVPLPESVKSEIAAKDASIKKLTEDNAALGIAAKKIAYTLFAERNLMGRKDVSKILRLVGDVSKYESLDKLKESLTKIVEDVDLADNLVKERMGKIQGQVEVEIKKIQEDFSKKEKERNDEISELKTEVRRAALVIKKLKQSSDKSIAESHIKERIISSPRKKMFSKILENVEGVKDADKIIDALNEDGNSRFYNRVRKSVDDAAYPSKEKVRDLVMHEKDGGGNSKGDLEEELESLGINLNDLLESARVKK
jgi:hypothetical protein